MEELTKASHTLAELLYKQAAPEGGADAPGGASAPEDDVVDAEVVDKGSEDDKEK
jgi:hypothetical protein